MARGRVRAGPSGPPIDGTAIGQLLRWDGLQWVPFGQGTDVGDILQWNGSQYVPAGGAGVAVGQTLVWNGTQWVPGSASPTGITQKIFEWDGSTTDQFEGTFAAIRVFTSATLAVIADATLPKGAKLRLSSVGGGGGELVWLSNVPLVFTGTEKNIRIRVEVVGCTNEFAGIAFLCQRDGSNNFYGFTDVNGSVGAGWRGRWDAGTSVISGSTQRGMHPAGVGTNNILTIYDWHLRADKQDGSPPTFFLAAQSGNASNAAQIGRKAWSLEEALTIVPTWAAMPAGWNPLNDLNLWGLAIQANSGDTVFDIHAIEIWTDGFTNVSV